MSPMRFQFRKRIPLLGRLVGMNVSRGGTSFTIRPFPGVSWNSKRGWTINTPGLGSFRQTRRRR